MLNFSDYKDTYELDLEAAWQSEDKCELDFEDYVRTMYQEYSMAEEEALVEAGECRNEYTD